MGESRMMRFMVFVVTLTALAGTSFAYGEDASDVKSLKKEIELLKSQLEFSKQKVEKLEAENAVLRKKIGESPAAKSGDEKPTYTKKWAGSEGGVEVVYTLEDMSRDGRKVKFEFTATLKKGNRKFTTLSHITGLDQDGNEVVLRLNPGEKSPKAFGVTANLSLGEAVKLVAWAEIPDEVTKFKSMKFTSGTLTKIPEIEFDNLVLPVKK
jgi:regulator of replication initiation timing